MASVQQPDTQSVWVLADEDCDNAPDLLRSYDLVSGEMLSEIALEQDHFDSELYAVYNRPNTLGVRQDGTLQLLMEDQETYAFNNVIIDPISGSVTPDEDATEAFNARLADFNDYPAYSTTFNEDYTLAAITDDTVLHIIDMATGDDLFQLEDPYASVIFSSDSKLLYSSSLKDPSGSDFDEAIFTVYTIPSGEIVKSAGLPLLNPYPSPDGQKIAALFVAHEAGSEQLGTFYLDTSLVSPLLLAAEEPKRVTKCTNKDRDLSDENYTTSGHLWLTGLYWLTDGSGFVTFNSQDGASTSSGCMIDYGRLRHYSVIGG